MRRRKEQEKICHVCHKIQSTKWRRVIEDALIKCKDTGIRLEVDNYLCNVCYAHYISNYIHNCKNKTRNKKNFFHSLPSFKFNLSLLILISLIHQLILPTIQVYLLITQLIKMV